MIIVGILIKLFIKLKRNHNPQAIFNSDIYYCSECWSEIMGIDSNNIYYCSCSIWKIFI